MSVEVKSILTPKLWATVIVTAIILCFVGVLSAPFAPRWAWSMIFGSFTGPLVIFFILLIISRVSTITGLDRRKLGLLYTVASMSFVFCYSMIPYGILHNSVRIRLTTFAPYTDAVAGTFVFGPTDKDLVALIQTGGVPAPIGAWGAWIGWWTLYAIAWLLFWVGWFALLERRWIEVERVPFPAAVTGTLTAELITAPKEEGDPRLKYFMVGWIIGAIAILPVILHALYPAFPDIYGWSAAPYLSWWLGTINLSGVPATKVIPVWAFLAVNPMIYALFFLFPLKILFSIWVTQIFGVLIPAQIAWYAGYYSGITEAGWRAGFLLGQPPFKYNGIWMGSFIGLILIWFVLNASYMKSLFKKAEEPERVAIPHELGWAFIIIGAVIVLGLLLAAGVSAAGAILILFTMWILFLSSVRVFGFASIVGTAWFGPFDWTHYMAFTKYLWHPGMTTDILSANPELCRVYATTMYLTNRFTGEIMGENNTQFGMAFAIPMCYRVGVDLGVHPRDITKIILVTGIISAIIGFSTCVAYDYLIGTNNTPMRLYDAWWVGVFARAETVENQPTSEPLWPYLLVGIIISVILSILNFRYVWWPLDPAGVAVGFSGGGSAWIFPALIAWIVKSVMMRIGGTKLVDRTLTPFMVGLLVGYWFLMFLGAFLGMIKFFMPA